MAQTLNFDVQINQSQLPSAIQQIQSGINTQLQSGALQLGTMANGLSATMAGMNALGVTPGAMGFAHAMAPGQVNYALGRQPFVDRTASILDFMNQAGGAVKMRASSIVMGMDPNKIAPTIGSDSRWGGVGKALGAGVLGFAGMMIGGPLGAKAGTMLGMSGTLGSMFSSTVGFMGAGKAADWATNKLGWGSKSWSAEELQKLPIERRGYADIAGAFMALGPQKYLPKLGQELDTTKNIAFGKSISEAFMARKDFSIIAQAAGRNPSYLTDMLSSLAVTDRAGYQKYIAPLHAYAGANAGAAPESLTRPAVSYATQAELMAQASGYSSITSKEYKAHAAWMQGGGLVMPKYTGPNMYQMLGAQMGTQMRMGKQFGSDFVNSLRSRVEKDLGLSPEERRWSGGNRGIATQYAGTVMGEMATFGSPTSIAYAAMQNGGMTSDIYDNNARAAGVFSDPRQYVNFRLNYRNIVRSAGPTDAVYRRNMVSVAKEMMVQSGGAFGNEHDALRMMFMGQGMNDEAASVQAGMILNVGKTLVTKGGSGARIAIWDRLQPGAQQEFMRKMVVGGSATDYKDAEAKMKRKDWSSALTFKEGFELGGSEASSLRFSAYMAGGRTTDKEWGEKQYNELRRVGKTDAQIQAFSKGNYQTQKEDLGLAMYEMNVDEKGFGIRNRVHLNTMIKLKNMGGDIMERMAEAAKMYQKAGASDDERRNAMGVAASLLGGKTEGIESILSSTFATREQVIALEKEQKAGNVHFSGADGKGKAGEYDMDQTISDIAADLRRAATGIEKYNKMQKGK